MHVKFFDRENDRNPLNGSILDHSDLSELLNRLQGRAPFFCEVVAENGDALLLGIGGPRGCVQFTQANGEPPYLVAVSQDPDGSKEGFEFMIGGTLTPVASRYCMSFDAVNETAAHFQETGQRSPMVSWEKI